MAGARLIRSVGFEQQRLVRHRCDHSAQFTRARETHGGGNTEFETQVMQLQSLLLAAGKTVHYATIPGMLAQQADDFIHRLAHVHNER